MKTALKYIGLIIVFTFISSGVLVAGFLDAYPYVGYNMLWLLLPMTALFIGAVMINDRLLVPRLLLRKRYIGFIVAVFATVFFVTLMSLGMEYATRTFLDLPMRIKDYTCPWILADTFCNGMLLAMILFGLGLLHIFKRWKAEQATASGITEKLEAYIATVKNRLNPTLLYSRLQEISSTDTSMPEEMSCRIRNFSEELRCLLYDLPTPPVTTLQEDETDPHTRVTEWIVSRRYRLQRNIVFISVLIIISCGALFVTPDRPEFSLNRFLGVLSMFTLLAGVAYINILWLYPRYLKRANLKSYVMAVGVMLALLIVPLIVGQVLTYESNVYDKGLPLLIAFISTVGTVMTLFLFVGGVSAFLILQNWITMQKRITLLRAETVKQEYLFLRKQINPHFMFNVLNNIGVTAYDNPAVASQLLGDLRKLLKYQLADFNRSETTLQEEITFIKSYFALEATRRDKFGYNLEIEESLLDTKIPTLLYNPFVENAAKYSSWTQGQNNVEIIFQKCGSRLKFVCRNVYNPDKVKKMRSGGIGIDNTLRRLKYLYENDFIYRSSRDNNVYNVELIIPLSK